MTASQCSEGALKWKEGKNNKGADEKIAGKKIVREIPRLSYDEKFEFKIVNNKIEHPKL